MPPGFAKSHWQLFLLFQMGWVRLNGKNLASCPYDPTLSHGPTSVEGLGLAGLGCELLEPDGFDFETNFLPVLRMGFILCSQRFFSLIEERGSAGAGQSSQQV